MSSLPYTLIRSDRRTLAVEIRTDGTVAVRAPKYMPERQIRRFVEARKDWIETHVQKQLAKQRTAPSPLTAAEAESLRERAKAELPARTAYYAVRMGLAVPEVRIGSARTRYGSCTAKNVLHFSRYLMANEADAIDYVVVHELAHIRHKNHSPQFYAEIAKILPDWKERRKKLFMPALVPIREEERE